MTKINIDGMMCMHCVGAVKKALSALGIDAQVNLEEKCAYIPESADLKAAIKAIEDAGYTVV